MRAVTEAWGWRETPLAGAGLLVEEGFFESGLTTANHVEYNGVKYGVTRIDTFEGYKQDITLYCKRQ